MFDAFVAFDKQGKKMKTSTTMMWLAAASVMSVSVQAQQAVLPPAHDLGARTGAVDAGKPLATLSIDELNFFEDGLARFNNIDSVRGTIAGEPGIGLGPTFNSNSCGSCHAQPSVGGTSPSATIFPRIGPNPQIAVATAHGARNTIPAFLTSDGPVREVRFPFALNADGSLSQTPDGGVRALFTIAGRSDAGACNLAQTDFNRALQLGNVVFRIPTPVYGAGLIENIADAKILANAAANAALKQQLGIGGHANTSGNDGSITRFGGRRKTNRCRFFPARLTTSRWA
jgi:hypothetical protein